MNVTGEETQYFLIHTTGLVIDKDATTLHQVVNGGDEKLEIRRTFMLVTFINLGNIHSLK
jgi:hypothetical protein